MTARTYANRCRPPRRHQGTAMTEMILVIPFLATILGLTFFFGWAMMHKQQVLVADRYAAWRRIETGAWPTENDLNRMVFVNKAQDVQLSGTTDGLKETPRDLVGEADARHQLAGALADDLVVQRFPAGRRADVAASFDADKALWEKFTGHIRHHHGREGVTWRRDEVHCWTTLRNQFYSDFDEDMRSIPAPANGMANTIRRLYLAIWPSYYDVADL